jgi:hypothetical protein
MSITKVSSTGTAQYSYLSSSSSSNFVRHLYVSSPTAFTLYSCSEKVGSEDYLEFGVFTLDSGYSISSYVSMKTSSSSSTKLLCAGLYGRGNIIYAFV